MVKGRNTNRRKERAKLDRNMQVTEIERQRGTIKKERERVAEEIKTETKRKKVREK